MCAARRGSSGPCDSARSHSGTGAAFHQKRRAAFQFGAQQIHAALGFAPVAHDDIFKLFVQKLFRRAFPGRIDIDEIRQHAFGTKLARAAGFERGQKLPRRFGRVIVMRQDVLDRFLFGAQAGAFGAQLFDAARAVRPRPDVYRPGRLRSGGGWKSRPAIRAGARRCGRKAASGRLRGARFRWRRSLLHLRARSRSRSIPAR